MCLYLPSKCLEPKAIKQHVCGLHPTRLHRFRLGTSKSWVQEVIVFGHNNSHNLRSAISNAQSSCTPLLVMDPPKVDLEKTWMQVFYLGHEGLGK